MDEQQPLRGNKRRKLEVTSNSMVPEDVLLEMLVRLSDYKMRNPVWPRLQALVPSHFSFRTFHFSFKPSTTITATNDKSYYSRVVLIVRIHYCLIPLLFRDNDF
ncbi:hypothetical protein TorRG33x02_024760 [Trema orientale]|uniref:Uncharacterized protein n=1 Tax=Trema orientale TaxID=63057 RepID=A0A2P5FV86_TREOI|nr:hypothetical protein TorRG33x02_024760 [Trema orientale]